MELAINNYRQFIDMARFISYLKTFVKDSVSINLT